MKNGATPNRPSCTHKDIHVAVAINGIGTHLGTLTIPVSPKGYQNLETWARAFGSIHAFGSEGTGSYGAGLVRFLQAKGHTVVEVNHPNRQLRHQNGKSDPLDAESAARAVLGGVTDLSELTVAEFALLDEEAKCAISKFRPVRTTCDPRCPGANEGNKRASLSP